MGDKKFTTQDLKILSVWILLHWSSLNQRLLSIALSTFFTCNNNMLWSKHKQWTCKGSLPEKQCLTAFKTMDKEKSPGSNQLPAEFYKTFWTCCIQCANKFLKLQLQNKPNIHYTEGRYDKTYTKKGGWTTLH